MTDQRFPSLFLSGRPSAVNSATRGLSTRFAGISQINSGSASVVVTGAAISSDSAVFITPMQTAFTAVLSGSGARALTVCSLTTMTASTPDFGGAFYISTHDGAAASSVAAVKVGWMVWNLH